MNAPARRHRWASGIAGRRGRPWVRFAWVVSLVAIVLGVAHLVLLARNAHESGSETYAYWGASAVMAMLFPVVGAVIVSRFPAHALGWLFCLIGVSTASGHFATEYAKLALRAGSGPLPGATAAAWLGSYLSDLGFVALPLVVLLFPSGRPPTKGWRPFLWLVTSAWAVLTLATALMPGPLPRFPSITNPAGAVGAAPLLETMRSVAPPILALGLFAGLASLVLRYRRSHGIERQQLKWFMYAAALVPASLLGNTLFPDLAWAIGALGAAAMPVAIGIAITRYRLYDIDRIVNRTLVYGALTICIVGLYVVVVGYLGARVTAEDDLLVSLIGAGLVAAIFGPLRDRLQRIVDRVTYGERDDPYAVVSRLGERLEGVLEASSVLPMVVHTVQDALKLPYVGISLRQGNRLERAAAAGTPADPMVQLPLVHQGRELGILHVAARSEDEPFDDRDLRLLNDLARQISLAAHATRLTTELQRSRENLVTAREEERRRLRRDLHDGLGPRLASQSLKLEAARDLLHSDPDRAHALLDGLLEQSQAQIGEIRRLVYALRPPALDQLGLVSAIREHAVQASPANLRVDLDLPSSLGPLPAAVEVAAYRIFQEAFTNVVRHARARSCLVRLDLHDGDAKPELRLRVRDDGVGSTGGASSGVGLVAMRERAEELGGLFRLESAPGAGTEVHAVLPCEPRGGDGED